MDRKELLLSRVREERTERDRLSGIITELRDLVKDGLPTTITKWIAFGTKLLKILGEAAM